MKAQSAIFLCFSLLLGFGAADLLAQDGRPDRPKTSATLMDVHGAGAQRSDPKTGEPKDYPQGHGPQGDVIRIFNYARAVRSVSAVSATYPVVDTGQTTFFDAAKSIPAPSAGGKFYGQDASYTGLAPKYRDNGDGTVSDLNTGLTWQQDPGKKITRTEAADKLKTFRLGGHSDWRLPTVKELYSLILFSGGDVSSEMKGGKLTSNPFIDTHYFKFSYGDEAAGERIIDSQYLSSTKYVSTTMDGDETVFGVNFADGRIKGYPIRDKASGKEKSFSVIFVRDNTAYGKNRFADNKDGTVTDAATGLMWLQNDSGAAMSWEDALAWAEGLNFAGYGDWRLPDAKELQSLVDYTRSPATHGSAAIDPIFKTSVIQDEAKAKNFPFYWASTTHMTADGAGASAVYLAFGTALGYMSQGGPPGGEAQGNNRQPPEGGQRPNDRPGPGQGPGPNNRKPPMQ